MLLEVDEKNLNLLGVHFGDYATFKAIWYALSSNMIEGWQPTKKDVLALKEHKKGWTLQVLTNMSPQANVNIDDPYTYLGTSVLCNKFNIQDAKLASQKEFELVAHRLLDLVQKPLEIHSMSDICMVHKRLFGEMYLWAGKYRTVNITKGQTNFMPRQAFTNSEDYINSLLVKYWQNDGTLESVAHDLAEILDSLNYMHPFREGNGRTQREVIRLLVLSKGYQAEILLGADAKAYDLYMSGTINGDLTFLNDLFMQILKKQ